MRTALLPFAAVAVTGVLAGTSLSSAQWRTSPSARPEDSVCLEELTWMEVHDGMKAGTTTVIVPTGGTEQGGRTSCSARRTTW